MKRKKDSTIFAALSALAIVAGLTTQVRADIAYGYAQQTISNVSLTATSGTLNGVTLVNTSTLDGATVNGSGISKSDPLDALQTYFGPGAPPENTFTRTALGAPPAGVSFTRGDVQILGVGTPIASASVVSESLLNGSGPSSETANSALTATVTFTPSVTSTLAVTYSYANDIYVATTGAGAATASYNFDFTIKNAAGLIVFQYGASPASANTNASLSAPPPGGEVIRSGTDTVTTTSTLVGGQNYTLIFSVKSASSVTIAAVPEPSPIALLGVMGTIGGAASQWKRRRAKA